MSNIALIAHFDGDAREIEERFRAAATQYSRDLDAPQPTSALLMRNKQGIVVVLTWPEGSGIKPFQTFLRGSLMEFGLPHPRVEHFRAEAIPWGSGVR
jgi:hypothetical protein